jgi:hypothetical protein
LGVATFKVSLDAGQTFSAPTLISNSAPQSIGAGLSINWQTSPAPVWTVDNIYQASTPVPQIVLAWLTTLVTLRAYRKRGVNPQDPQIDLLVKEAEQVRLEIKEAADSKDGLFDLPTNDDQDSAITTGGPRGHSDASPYAWQDRQAVRGYSQDGSGGYG